ncbi:hypothetical protein BaRGS_00016693 [Batillaria attramentaria]|uniref:Uncharacterized protein n=1 Tax=Batillaria attramentaria TaxID=370345 RepID=A0ABD0KXU1_9CAEN
MHTPATHSTARKSRSRDEWNVDFMNSYLPDRNRRRSAGERRVTFKGDSPRVASGHMRPVTVHCVDRPAAGDMLPSPRGQQSPLLPQRSTSASSRRTSMSRTGRGRPRTVSAKFRSRPLGADIYPTLGNSDIDREKAYFRSGIGLINYLFSTTPRTLSARWRAMAPEGESPTGDSFCRSSRAESHMNNAQLAKVYHVVPERVVSARAPLGGQSLLLQQLNQSLCDRRVTYTHRIASVGVGDENEEDVKPDPAEPTTQSPLLKYRVDPLEHSAEWLEETKTKHEESVAILSQQLKSMLEDSPRASATLPQEHGSREFADDSPKVSNTPTKVEVPRATPETLVQARSGGIEGTGTGLSRPSSLSTDSRNDNSSRMKMVQCEVLGPYSCADCTKLRLSERQQQEQRALFPGLSVHPRTLVAPQLLKRITSTLPPALTGEKYRLDCGCAISLHRDFLFPVIVTDHDVHSRLCAVKRGPAKTPSAGRSSTSREELHSQGSLPTGMEDGRGVEAGHGTLGVEEPEEEEVSMSPADMRVTVRYNTPSPEQKGVFIT